MVKEWKNGNSDSTQGTENLKLESGRGGGAGREYGYQYRDPQAPLKQQ